MEIVDSIGGDKQLKKNLEENDDLEDYEQLTMNELCNYHKLVTDQINIPQIYNTILEQNEDKSNEYDDTTRHQTSRRAKHCTTSINKPSTHSFLAVLSLFICICCWPAAPCGILATVHSMQVNQWWSAGYQQEAKLASQKARQLATAALVCGGVSMLSCFLTSLATVLTTLGILGYFSQMIYFKPT